MRRAWMLAASITTCLTAAGLRAAQAPPAAEPESALEPQAPEPQETPEAEPEPPLELDEGVAGPTPGAPTVGLGQAIRMALEGNFGLLGQADGVVSARLRENVARAAFRPQLTPRYQGSSDDRTFSLDLLQRLPWTGGTLSASGSLRTTDREDAFFPRTADLRLTLSQPLLQGFGPTAARFDLVNSRRSREAQERSFRLSQQRLVVDVASAFYQVARQRQLRLVAERSLERSERLRHASEARLRVGLASKLDVLRAELQASQARESAVAAETALQTGLEQFRFLLGLGPDEALEPEAVVLPRELTDPLPPLEPLVETALAQRLDLREAADQVEDAERAASIARQRQLPELNLNVGLTQRGFGENVADSFRDMDRRVDVFVTTSYPVNRSATAAAKAVAEMELASRERTLRQRRLEIESEVRTALRELTRIRKSVELQSTGLEFARQQHRLATLRYQRGLASNFDVVDAEAALVSARTALVNLITDYQVARIRLQRVTGELDPAASFELPGAAEP